MGQAECHCNSDGSHETQGESPTAEEEKNSEWDTEVSDVFRASEEGSPRSGDTKAREARL